MLVVVLLFEDFKSILEVPQNIFVVLFSLFFLDGLFRDGLQSLLLPLVVPSCTSQVVQSVSLQLRFRSKLQAITVEVLSGLIVALQEVHVLNNHRSMILILTPMR